MKIQLYMHRKYFTCEGRLSKVHSGKTKAQAAGIGEKVLESKTAAGQSRAAMGHSRKTQARCLLCLPRLLAAVGTASTKQPRKNKFLPL